MNRLLVVKLGDIGDAILATPALRALRTTWPEAEIDVLCSANGASALEGLPGLHELVVVNKKTLDRPAGLLNPGVTLSALKQAGRLRSRRYDAALIFHHLFTRWGSLKYEWMARAIGAGRTAGLGQDRVGFLTDQVEDAGFGQRHESEYWLEVARAVGAEAPPSLRAEIYINDEERTEANRLLPTDGKAPLVALHPGSGDYSHARRWPWQGFAEAAGELGRSHEVRLVLVGSKAEAGLNRKLMEAAKAPIIDLTGKTTVKTLAACLERCALLVGNDSGVAHLASAVGTRSLTIFGPSNAAAWSPIGSVRWQPEDELPAVEEYKGMYVELGLPCQPCLYRRYSVGSRLGCPSRQCLALIKPSDVSRAARHLLRQTGLGN